VETTIEYENETLFGGNAVYLAARTGSILPVDWQFNQDIMIHYVTSEIVEITDDGSVITLKTAQHEFSAELTLAGYSCVPSIPIQKSAKTERIRLHGKDGRIVLRKDGK